MWQLARRGVSQSVALASRTPAPNKGKFQYWRTPVEYTPHVSPLQEGPDFSRLDGQPVRFTSPEQLRRKVEQNELGQQVVAALAEMRDMEAAFEKATQQQRAEHEKRQSARPVKKGVKAIA